MDAIVRKPAEAEKYRLEKIASANKSKVVLEAQAQSESIRMKGEAKAFAIQAKAKAEAEQMAKKAEAWKEYKDAALVDMMLDTLPKVAEEIAAPLTKTKKVVMVSSGNSDVGASKLTEEVIDIIEKLPKVVNNMTGVDITKVCINIIRIKISNFRPILSYLLFITSKYKIKRFLAPTKSILPVRHTINFLLFFK